MLVCARNLASKPDNRHSSGCYAALNQPIFLKLRHPGTRVTPSSESIAKKMDFRIVNSSNLAALSLWCR